MDFADEGFGGGPIDAAIGDRDAIAKVFLGLREGLAACFEIALDHRAHDGAVTRGDLGEDLAHDLGLAFGLLGGVVVGAVNKDGFVEPGLFELGLGVGDVRRVEIGSSRSAPQDDVAGGITSRDHGRGRAIEIDSEESLGLSGGLNRVECGFEGAVGAVLETERHGQAGGHLTMGLRFRGARADGGPADKIGDVLGRDRIEELRGGGQAEIEHFPQKGAAGAQAGGDIVGAVEMRIHDEPLPADGGARFFKIHAHDHHDTVGNFRGESREPLRIVTTRFQVVDGAGADDEQEPFVIGEDDAMEVASGLGHKFGLRSGLGQLVEEIGGRREDPCLNDIDVGSLLHERSTWSERRDGGKTQMSHFVWTKKWPAAYP